MRRNDLRPSHARSTKMTAPASRILLALSAVIMVLGGPLHAAAFKKAAAVLAASNIPAFYCGSFKGLWLADSATLITLAMTFAVIAVRPAAAARPVVMLLAVIPGATAELVYFFVGPFFAAHLLMLAAIAAFVGGLLLPQAGAES